MTEPRRSVRTVTEADKNKPVYAVWELTIRCDHACAHCGSRAGNFQRPDELSRDELLGICDSLAGLGCREVTLIGGEAYLSPHCTAIIRRLTDLGIRVTMQTGGLGFTPARAERLKEAGLKAVGFSIDGPADVHDVLRDRPGSWQLATAGLKNARDAGLIVTANSQINRLNKDRLRETATFLHEMGARIWRCQLTVPMGRAADRPDWILEPYQILDVVDELAALQIEYAEQAHAQGLAPKRMFNILASNNIGYYGPHEILLRSNPGTFEAYWRGCQAGRYTIGIESDGKIKACPSLPTAPYVGGNVRDLSLEQIWFETPELNFVETRTTDELWGFCKSCYYADECRAGCSFTAHCTLGRRGNMPFCYHRAATLKKQGKRERLVQKERAEGIPYDFGRFEIIEEPWPQA
ncbi:MAG: radical SAM protein [Alphaproteobacteria bacterium]|nr:radical SAM protein [Alphaproteobacteria bacterium]